MSRFHPSWPSPLLALDPIRLRPMGWLDDLLPMRPPSLWRDRSLYARALRWQPDMADLSWLFDAYAMLGIEMPPPRIEHRTHQRSPQRGRLKGNGRQTQLRRRRAPIKGANRPLAIPRWSSPPQMVAPIRTETQDRVENTPSFRTRRTVASPNLAKVAWRSPERTAPIPTLARATGSQITPTLGSQPTLLRKNDPVDESNRSNKQSIQTVERRQSTESISIESSERIRPTSKYDPGVLAPRKAKVQRFPSLSSTSSAKTVEVSPSEARSAPPPKVTWQQGHTRSPWRLNQTGRTLFNPRTVRSKSPDVEGAKRRAQPPQIESTESTQRRLAGQITRIGKPVVQQKSSDSSKIPPRSFQFRAVVEQVEWSPVRKGFIRDAVLEQGAVRAVTPVVQMDLAPLAKIELERPNVANRRPLTSTDSDDTGQRTQTQSNKNQSSPVSNVTKADASVEPVVIQAGRARLQRQLTQRTSSKLVETTVQNVRLSKSTPAVQVPTRVPWRLSSTVSSPSVSKIKDKVVPDQSVNPVSRRAVIPVAQQTSTRLKHQRPPQVSSWFLPQRHRLIEHFQSQRFVPLERGKVERFVSKGVEQAASLMVTPAISKTELDSARPMTAPSYSFASTGSPKTSVFRVQEQTMVAPLRAGILVFPTPVIQDQTVVKESASGSTVKPSKQTAAVQSLKSQREVQYPDPFVQSKDVYQRRTVETRTASWRLSRRKTSDVNVSPVTRVLEEKGVQSRWRQPYIPLPRTVSEITSARNRVKILPQVPTSKSVFRAPGTFWQGSFAQSRGSVQLQSPMVFTTPSNESENRSVRLEPKPTKTTVYSNPSTQRKRTSNTNTRWIPKQVLDVNVPSVNTTRASDLEAKNTARKRSVSQRHTPVQSVSWRRKPSFPDPFVAHRRTVSSEMFIERTKLDARTPAGTEGVRQVKPKLTDPTVEASMLRTAVQTQQDVDNANRRDRRPELTPTVGVRRTLQAPQSSTSPVRRVVAPTLSAAIVYNSTAVESTNQRTDRSSEGYSASSKPQRVSSAGSTESVQSRMSSAGKYGPNRLGGAVRSVAPSTGSVSESSRATGARIKVESERLKSVGKYGPTAQSSTDRVIQSDVDVPIERNVTEPRGSTSLDVQSPYEAANDVTVQDRVVRKAVRNLVRRLPTTQQALLRSKISLPTNWARRLGLAPTAEVRMRWRLQQTLSSVGSFSDPIVTPQLSAGAQQFVIPSGESSDVSGPMSRPKIEQTNDTPIGKSVQSTAQKSATQQVKRRLSNAQINRIIERQVSFFRSAQRQSFLKVSQMTEGSASTSVPLARGGLQQVTGEMRQALQRMVFSSESQPVFLDSIPDAETIPSRTSSTAQKQESSLSKATSKTRTVQKTKRLGARTPRWRPGVHTPSPVARYSRTSSPDKRARVVGTPSNSEMGTVISPTSSLVPNTTPMTIVQPDQSTQTVEQRASKIDRVNESRPTKRNITEPPSSVVRRKGSRGRSSTVAPKSLMGTSDVGVFLQPKKKTTDPDNVVLKPQPQSSDSVDSEADVFMVDPTGNLLTGEKAKKRLKELGFARTESAKPSKTSTMDTSSGSYTWQAPAEMMEEAVKQVRKEMGGQDQVKESSRPTPRPVRQSVIKEWTEEQLLTILVELASSSPEANALLRDVQERVEEYFDLERFRKI